MHGAVSRQYHHRYLMKSVSVVITSPGATKCKCLDSSSTSIAACHVGVFASLIAVFVFHDPLPTVTRQRTQRRQRREQLAS